MSDDDMGNPDNITTKDLAKAAIASGISGQGTIREMKKALETLNPEKLEEEIKKKREQKTA